MRTILRTIAQALRNPANSPFLLPSSVVPAGADGEFIIQLDIAQADFADPTKSITYRVERFDTVKGTWRKVAGTTWVGAVGADFSDPIQRANASLWVTLDVLRGQDCRCVFEIPVALTAGCTFEVER